MSWRLVVEPSIAPYDEPFSIRVDGASEGVAISVSAELTEVDGAVWRSQGDYDVGPGGYLTDPMRVIWSAERAQRTAPPNHVGSDVTIDLTAEYDGHSSVASAVRVDPSVGRGIKPDDPEIVGQLFVPHEDGAYPPVLLLGGAEGGFHQRHPALIARHGFTVLSLAYFRYAGQPNLVEVPLERFEHALRWLLAHPQVDGRRAAVIGGSFGGQAAPLVAATFPLLAGAAVALGGSGVVTSGIPGHQTLLENFRDARSPWSLGGRPLDFIHGTGEEFERQCQSGGPVQMRLAFEAAMRDAEALERAAIPVEAIDGPLLMLSGDDDQNWPCVALSEVAVERRRQSGLPVEHVVYQGAGHGLIPPPYGPTTDLVMAPFQLLVGGTPALNAAAREDVWRRALSFLAAHAGH
jgi:dienelactone hydrolase